MDFDRLHRTHCRVGRSAPPPSPRACPGRSARSASRRRTTTRSCRAYASPVRRCRERGCPREVVGAATRLVRAACPDTDDTYGTVAVLVGERRVDAVRDRIDLRRECVESHQLDEEVRTAEPVAVQNFLRLASGEVLARHIRTGDRVRSTQFEEPVDVPRRERIGGVGGDRAERLVTDRTVGRLVDDGRRHRGRRRGRRRHRRRRRVALSTPTRLRRMSTRPERAAMPPRRQGCASGHDARARGVQPFHGCTSCCFGAFAAG